MKHFVIVWENLMAFIPVPDCMMVELQFDLAGQKAENTLYFVSNNQPDEYIMNGVASFLYNWWFTNFQPLAPGLVKLEQVKVTDLSSDTGPIWEYSGEGPLTGGAPWDMLPSNAALCVQFRTAGRGRSSRGRNYIGGLSEAQVAGNTVIPSFVNVVLTAYQELLGVGAVWPETQWVVVSRYHDKAPRAVGIAQAVLSVRVADPYIDSQRRRLPGRGT